MTCYIIYLPYNAQKIGEFTLEHTVTLSNIDIFINFRVFSRYLELSSKVNADFFHFFKVASPSKREGFKTNTKNASSPKYTQFSCNPLSDRFHTRNIKQVFK